MQRVIVFAIWILFSLLVQTVLLPDFPSVKVWSDLLFYLVIILGLKFSLPTGILLSCVLGYIVDSVSMVPFGTSIISYVLTLLLIRKVMANIYLENKLSLFFWVMIFSFFRQAVQIFIFSARFESFDISVATIVTMLLQSLWDGFLGLFILPLLEKLMFRDWAAFFRKKGIKV
jgi:rod shape-determining protein MreD